MEEEKGIPPQAWLRVIIFLIVVGSLVWYFGKQGAVPPSQQFLPPQVTGTMKVLGEKAELVVPKETREVIGKTVEESQIVKEVKKTIDNALEEISQFPEKQKKAAKKKIIQQTCDQLLKDLENE